MRAALFRQFNEPLVVEDLPDPPCPVNGVVISVSACGVCRSDWHGWRGTDPDIVLPHVPGHELAGVVVETGTETRRFQIGDRVTVPFILGCGNCADCRAGDATICDRQEIVGFTGWGAFAELVAVPRADFNLVPLPDQIDMVAAAGMGCRVTTAFQAIIERAGLSPGEILAVHGCGGIGLSAVMIGAAAGARVIAVDINPEALEMAQRLGADDLVNAGDVENAGAAIRELCGGAHVSVDALGITETFHNSILSLRKLGRHVQIGMPVAAHANPTVPLLDVVYAHQISIIGTRGMAAHRFGRLFAMVAAGRLNPVDLVTRRIPLEQAGPELEAMNRVGSSGIAVIDAF